MRFWVLLTIISLTLSACVTRKQKSGFEEISDFGLSDDGEGVKVDDRAYFDDLKRSEASVVFESSLPLPLRVGKSGDPFDDIPQMGKPGVESRLIVQIGPCTVTLLSGPVQVDRYLLADKWIKLTEGLPAKTPVKLEPNQDLNLKAVSKLSVEVTESMMPTCRKQFEGRKFFLGRFHLNKSRIGLVPGRGAPPIQFGARSLDPQGKMVYLHWLSGSNAPSVIDDFDFPATAESGIFRAQMSNKGYYYLAFQTVLRMDQVDSIVIKLPLNGSPVVNKAAPGKTPAPQVKTSTPMNSQSQTAPTQGQGSGNPPSSSQPQVKVGTPSGTPGQGKPAVSAGSQTQAKPGTPSVGAQPAAGKTPAASQNSKTPVATHPAKALIAPASKGTKAVSPVPSKKTPPLKPKK